MFGVKLPAAISFGDPIALGREAILAGYTVQFTTATAPAVSRPGAARRAPWRGQRPVEAEAADRRRSIFGIYVTSGPPVRSLDEIQIMGRASRTQPEAHVKLCRPSRRT